MIYIFFEETPGLCSRYSTEDLSSSLEMATEEMGWRYQSKNKNGKTSIHITKSKWPFSDILKLDLAVDEEMELFSFRSKYLESNMVEEYRFSDKIVEKLKLVAQPLPQ